MYFIIASVIIAIACSVITIKTLVGYSDIKRKYKLIVGTLIVISWTAPSWIRIVRDANLLSPNNFALLSETGYFLFGTAFILFTMLILRDFVWFALYGVYSRFIRENWSIHPKNINLLDKANLLVVFITILMAFFALHSGLKTPDVKTLEFTSPRLEKDLRIVMVSDIHINRTTSVARVEELVNRINSLDPDIIALVGDIGDDKVETVTPQLDALSKLKSKYPVLVSFGNHEFYNGLIPWQFKFKQMGFIIMFNRGVKLPDNSVFIAGIPDSHTANNSAVWNVDFLKALKGSKPTYYRILLSHTPDFVDYLNKDSIDMQLSGHTHGGQLFPFQALVKYANKYLAGLYEVNGIKLYVSRGAGYWGPAMRLFAPSEITLIDLKAMPSPKSNNSENIR